MTDPINQNNSIKYRGPTYFKLHCFTTSKNLLALMIPVSIFCEACSMTHSNIDSLHTKSDMTQFKPAATSLSNYKHLDFDLELPVTLRSEQFYKQRFSRLKSLIYGDHVHVFDCITSATIMFRSNNTF